MKKCGHCKEEKEDVDFNWKNRDKGILQSMCRKCQYAFQAAWYRKNRKRHIANVAVNRKRYDRELVEKLVAYLREHPCVDCGETDPIVLEFDHQYGKHVNVSRLSSWDAMLKEIRKCVVRCANCHRRRTAKQIGWLKLSFCDKV